MKQLPHSFIILILASAFPVITFAQLSSTNYQVDVQYVGEEGGGYATSTSYQLQGVTGTPYEYVPSSSTPEETPDGSSSGSRVRTATTTPAETWDEVPAGAAGNGAYLPNGEVEGDGAVLEEETEDVSNGEGDGSIVEEIRESVKKVVESVAPQGSVFREIFFKHPFLSGLFFLLILLMILAILRYVRESRGN